MKRPAQLALPRWLHIGLRVLVAGTWVLCSSVLLGTLVLITVVVLSLRPQPGEWAVQLPLSVPGFAQPVPVALGVPSLIRLATQPQVARALAHRPWQLGPNRLRVHWQAGDKRLRVDCTPCWVQHPALAAQPVQISSLGADLQRYGEALHGSWWIGERAQAVRGSWRATLSQQQLDLQFELPDTPIAKAYAALAGALPEVRHAHIKGQFSLRASVRLPDGRWQLVPELQGMQVSGLGTEALRQLPTQNLRWQHPLLRAVLAAEDQRFEQHQGHDPNQWQQIFAQHAQGQGDALRGASTITQQLAKLIYTDGERTLLRKLRELLYAVEMEETLGKARILQLYLAHAPWGEAQVGAEAAAQHYFERPAARLSVAQSVWLAAMLNAPDRHARQWASSGQVDLRRADWVAQQLRQSGRGLSPKALAQVQLELAQLRRKRPTAEPDESPAPPFDPTEYARLAAN